MINPFNIKDKIKSSLSVGAPKGVKGIKASKGNKGLNVMMFLNKTYLIKGVIGIIALIISHIVVSFTAKTIVKVSNKNVGDNIKKSTAFHMIQSTIYWVLMSVCVIFILSFTGIQGAAIIAVLGSLLFAVGLGLQGTLGDLASGMMLIIGNVYKIGDFIEVLDVGNNMCNGTVKDFNVMYTRILDDDSSVILNVPNRLIYNNVVKNHSSSEKRVVYVVLTVSNRNKNLSIGLEKVRENVQSSEFVLSNPAVTTNITAINENGTVIEIRYAIKSNDYYVTGTKNIQGILMTRIREVLVDNNVELVIRG